MKRTILPLLVMFLALGVNATAYLSEIKFLPKEEIVKLTDTVLIDTYIDVMVELKAAESFHTTSGFSPKEYENYKELLRYKILLLQEIDKRKLAIPRMDASQ